MRKLNQRQLSERDLDFLVESSPVEVTNKAGLKRVLDTDEDFLVSYITDEKVFRRVMNDEQTFLRLSLPLFFEILLRRTAADLKQIGYTLERDHRLKIPVFDAEEVTEFLSRNDVLLYLAHMLASFTRLENYSLTIRVRKGIWRKIRFNDWDIYHLVKLADFMPEKYRFGIYQRIADVCLFITGLFPDYVEANYRYPLSGKIRPGWLGKYRISREDYEHEGSRFYEMAAGHDLAGEQQLSGLLMDLHHHFQAAVKPLNFMAEHYLLFKKHMLFG